MDPDKELSSLTLPNINLLRAKCLKRFWDEVKPTAQGVASPSLFTLDECVAASELFAKATSEYRGSASYDGPTCKDGTADWRWNEGFRIIQRDLDAMGSGLPDNELPPKWLVLANWLLPESAAGSCPEFTVRLVQACLHNTLVPYPHRR